MPDPIEVTLLTQDLCKLCDEAKAVLHRLRLTQRGGEFPVHVTTVSLGSERGKQLALAGGVMFRPGVFVDGEPFSYGRLSERKLRKALSRLAA